MSWNNYKIKLIFVFNVLLIVCYGYKFDFIGLFLLDKTNIYNILRFNEDIERINVKKYKNFVDFNIFEVGGHFVSLPLC